VSKKYTSHSNQFKFKVAVEALKGTKTTTQLCKEFGLVESQIYEWKKKLKESSALIFSAKGKLYNEDQEIKRLNATIDKLKVDRDFLFRVLGKPSLK